MADAAKKPSLAMVIGLGKGKAEPDDDDEDYDAAVGELADVLGVPEDKVDAFKSAFQAAVMSCR